MHSREVVSCALALVQRGFNDCQISRLTGVGRTTIRDWRSGRIPTRAQESHHGPGCLGAHVEKLPSASYAYLFGLYLGDGYIARHRHGVFILRIYMDSRYVGIIQSARRAMDVVRPESRASVIRVSGAQMVVIQSYSKHWPCLFPQHGPGRKHERPIRLTHWQQSLLEHHPEAFLRGLIHSDGCRFVNRVKHYQYPTYGFSNMSRDIIDSFTGACDQLGITWRRQSFKSIWISRREAVATMDTVVGPKS